MRIEEACILVVDDELELLEIFSSWLGRAGCHVLTAPNGVEALHILREQKVDVLISDMRMPIMDGATLVRKLRQMDVPQPKIIFVSGYGNVTRREIFGMGVEALLDKPLSRAKLLRALERSLADCEERWSNPSPEPMAQRLSLEMESLEEAVASCAFNLGRGGCCIVADAPLKEEATIDLSVRFAREGLRIEAQGTVVWFDDNLNRVGVAFEYLDPECRQWVLRRIEELKPTSFVSPC
jgi:CheY-like chemotaxis protein